ncbi:GL22726 [Drosophila persimilis]|uniref:GL22726 n=1 Tax=Drosophila persimilis TaxID=7234 RepID=B4GZT7_DROPE|nr:GL22726 [Drosophila persimilis]
MTNSPANMQLPLAPAAPPTQRTKSGRMEQSSSCPPESESELESELEPEPESRSMIPKKLIEFEASVYKPCKLDLLKKLRYRTVREMRIMLNGGSSYRCHGPPQRRSDGKDASLP